ncbi:MAG: heavy metal-binding domain-containing protein [Gemmatimonadetes bacterium]|nr:YbjQ family protein [Gemmatimonadota bacterium]NNM07507.1 heavy metal-binding domain-containing protein [Gemmatimonadota bacterium]
MEFLSLAIAPVMFLGAWIAGSILERRHLDNLLLLESGSKGTLAVTVEDLPPDWKVESCELVMGNVVISQDYFKRVAASIKGIFGGNLGVLEPLLERARREALIRMKGVAHARGYDTIINVRIETAPLARARGDGKGTAGVEILAFGTAILLSNKRKA